jgi:hypothetical protein
MRQVLALVSSRALFSRLDLFDLMKTGCDLLFWLAFLRRASTTTTPHFRDNYLRKLELFCISISSVDLIGSIQYLRRNTGQTSWFPEFLDNLIMKNVIPTRLSPYYF